MDGKVNGKNKNRITILMTSDIHGRFLPWDYSSNIEDKSGSMSQISTVVSEIRGKNPNTILLDAGDIVQDNLADLFIDYAAHPAIIGLNYLNYTAWTLGNHEFDYGFEVLGRITNQFKGITLAGNVFTDEGYRYFNSHTIVEIAGIKIGIIGMTTPLVEEFKKGKDIFNGKILRDPVAEAREVVDEIKDRVDILIGLMHMGIENENAVENTGVRDMAKAIPEFDIIFAGHTHKPEFEIVNGVPIAIPNKFGKSVIRADLILDFESGELLTEISNIDVEAYKQDEKFNELIMPFHRIASEYTNKLVGYIEGPSLVPQDEIKGVPQVQISETPLSNLIGEVMMHYGENPDVVAYQIDFDYPQFSNGSLRRSDISRVYNYPGGEISVYEISGRDLKDYMEFSAGYFNTLKTGDVNISFDVDRRTLKYNTNDFFYGVKYELDLREEYGNRIKKLSRLNGQTIKDDEILRIGMNSYRMNGLLSEEGVLHGRKVNRLSSTQDTNRYGEIEGRIKHLIETYIEVECGGHYKSHVEHNFRIVGIDEKLQFRNETIELINKGIVHTIDAKEEHGNNIKSINLYDEVSEEEKHRIGSLLEISIDELDDCETKGEFYEKIYNYVE